MIFEEDKDADLSLNKISLDNSHPTDETKRNQLTSARIEGTGFKYRDSMRRKLVDIFKGAVKDKTLQIPNEHRLLAVENAL